MMTFPVGLMSVAGTALRGAGRLIGVGHRKLTKELAKQYGATDVVDYTEGDIVEQIMELTNHQKVAQATGERHMVHQGACIGNSNVEALAEIIAGNVGWWVT